MVVARGRRAGREDGGRALGERERETTKLKRHSEGKYMVGWRFGVLLLEWQCRTLVMEVQRLKMIQVSKFFIFFKTSFVRVGNTMVGFWHVPVLVARAKPQPTQFFSHVKKKIRCRSHFYKSRKNIIKTQVFDLNWFNKYHNLII